MAKNLNQLATSRDEGDVGNNLFAQTGFVQESGITLSPGAGNEKTKKQLAKEYNDGWRAAAEAVKPWSEGERFFSGAMDTVGVFGHEEGAKRVFDSRTDLNTHEARLMLGHEDGFVFCQTSEHEGDVFSVGETRNPVDVQIADTFRYAHEGDTTAPDQRTRVTKITLTPREGKDALTDHEGTRFIPVYGRKTDTSDIPRHTPSGFAYTEKPPSYQPGERASRIEVEMLDGAIGWITINTAETRDDGQGEGMIVIDVAKLIEKQREINTDKSYGEQKNARHEDDVRILQSIATRMDGMFALQRNGMAMTKQERIEKTGLTSLAAKAAKNLNLIPDIQEPAA